MVKCWLFSNMELLRDSGTWYVLVVIQVMMFMVSLVGGLCLMPGSFLRTGSWSDHPGLQYNLESYMALALAN